MVPYLVLAMRTVSDEIAFLQAMFSAVYFDGQLALENESVFKSGMCNRSFGASGMWGVLIESNCYATFAVLPEQAADNV